MTRLLGFVAHSQLLTLVAAVLMGSAGGFIPTAALSAETVVTGVLGSYTSGVWPVLIGMKKGQFARHDINPDVVFAPDPDFGSPRLACGTFPPLEQDRD